MNSFHDDRVQSLTSSNDRVLPTWSGGALEVGGHTGGGLYIVVQEVELGDVPGVDGTPDHHLAPHGPSVDDLDQVHEVLLGLEAAHKLGVVRRPGRSNDHNTDTLRVQTPDGEDPPWCEHSPVVHLHVLPVEEEDGGGDVADVKVACVHRDPVHVHHVDGRHVAQFVRRFRQLGGSGSKE